LMSEQYYAHSLPGRPPAEWQTLEEHLKNVAEMARGFAESFEGGWVAWRGCVVIWENV
jgi:hypothetical protein